MAAARTKKTGGRRSLLTPERQERICTAIALGGTDEAGWTAGNVSRQTFYTWLNRGEEREQPYADFLDAVQRARGKREAAILLRLPEYNDWKADDAYLKHLRAREAAPSTRRKAEVDIRRAEAEARAAEAKADALEKAVTEGGKALLAVGLGELLDEMPGTLRDQVEDFLRRADVGLVRRRDLCPDIPKET